MHRLLQITGAFALAVLCPLSSYAEDSDTDAAQQPCATLSAERYCVVQVGGQVTTQAGPLTAWLDAITIVTDALVRRTGVTCGPCDIEDACQSRAYLENSIQTMGPTQLSPTTWICRAWYEGCYRIECGECDA